MKRKALFLAFLMFTFGIQPVMAGSLSWTEKKLGKVIIKADKAARKQQWSRAIQFGEKMLIASTTLDRESDPRYINLLKKLNSFYDAAGRLPEVSPRIEKAYILSRTHLPPDHETTLISRNLYYKLLIGQKEYLKAIPLVLENIALSETRHSHGFRQLHYLKQLYSLYGLTGQLQKEEATLLRFLAMNRELLGPQDEDSTAAVLILAQNYCRQHKAAAFKQLISSHNLKYYCP